MPKAVGSKGSKHKKEKQEMKKGLFLLIALMVVSLLLSNGVLAEEITIVGTGSGMSLLRAVGEAFTQKNPDVRIIVPDSIGSGGGVKAVGTDQYKIGRIARNIKEKEKHYGLTHVPFAQMPIVIFVNKSVGITSLTPEQVCGIYSGKIRNWNEVGGKGTRIKVICREPGDSSLRVLLESFPGFKDITLTPKSKTTYSDPKTCKFAEQKADTIAFGTYINARNYDVDILTINDKHPSKADYPYVGTLALVFKEKNRTGNIQKFVEFATSPAAHDAIRSAGGLPMTQ